MTPQEVLGDLVGGIKLSNDDFADDLRLKPFESSGGDFHFRSAAQSARSFGQTTSNSTICNKTFERGERQFRLLLCQFAISTKGAGDLSPCILRPGMNIYSIKIERKIPINCTVFNFHCPLYC